MNRLYVKLVPKLFKERVLLNINLNGKYLSSLVNSEKNENQLAHRNLLQNGGLNLYNSNVNHQFLQRRNLSLDYVNGSSIYKWIAESTPVSYTQNFIISVHDITGLPWWGTIICTTIALRTAITLPLAIYQTAIIAKIENISMLEMPEAAKEAKREVAILAMQNNWNERRTQLAFKRLVKNKWNTLIIRDNCHPFKGTITLWFQLPIWVCLTAALRNIAHMVPYDDPIIQLQYLQMSVGGFLWIPNLTIPDTTWFMPTILGFSNLAIIEIQSLKRIRHGTHTLHKYFTNTFRCLSLAMIPIAVTMPSAICLYWTTSSLVGLGQNLFLMSNRVRNVFNIPDTPSTLNNPYLQLMADIKETGKYWRNVFSKHKKN